LNVNLDWNKGWIMRKCLAFVLSGGGARGAFQVGALKALLEAGYQPDLLVGTSVGAINATYLAINGSNLNAIEKMIQAWQDAKQADLLPSNYLKLTLRTLLNRSMDYSAHHLRDFYIAHGLTPDFSFGDINGVRLITVAADLNSGKPVLYGLNPQDSVLEGVLASSALPPWVPPMERGERLLVDGGVVSVLPVEVALKAGASEIIALDLSDTRPLVLPVHGVVTLLGKVVATANHRQVELEIALARAEGIPVRHLLLRGEDPTAIWNFDKSDTRISHGYELTRQSIESWKPSRKSWLSRWLRRE
jgi:NTE family protein